MTQGVVKGWERGYTAATILSVTDHPESVARSRQREGMLARKARVQHQIDESPPPRVGRLDRDIYTPDDFAVVMGIDVETVLAWIRDGKLRALKLGGGAGQRIRIDAIHELLDRLEGETQASRE